MAPEKTEYRSKLSGEDEWSDWHPACFLNDQVREAVELLLNYTSPVLVFKGNDDGTEAEFRFIFPPPSL
jgi:hypothetical protein